MRKSPHFVAQELRNSLNSYLCSAYKLSHPLLFEERQMLLGADGATALAPLVETTPRFAPGCHLANLEHPMVPSELAELAAFGLPTAKHPLYGHQEEALRNAWAPDGTPRHLVVATGTGSGKTETFLLPPLADLVREARSWPAPEPDDPRGGYWDDEAKVWVDARAHEQRAAAVRMLVLYPMNALVNDQLGRLRRVLASEKAEAWQQEHFGGNRLYFGRYTGQTPVPGQPSEGKRRKRWKEACVRAEEQWQNLTPALQASGDWARPGSGEMMGRWDMQAAPPDVLVTNYSMLEYMLVRPIEAPIFEATRTWLAADRQRHVFTLVVDEAHTYTGAQGTEVAYLIRRLFERLGAEPQQIRCIATSASLGEGSRAVTEGKAFARDLFGVPADHVSVVQAHALPHQSDLPLPDACEAAAFARFQHALEGSGEGRMEEAARALIADLGHGAAGVDASQQLYRALGSSPAILHARRLAERRAVPWERMSEQLWRGVEDTALRRQATAGLFAAGAYARPGGADATDEPPLLPSRLHLFFRGVPGVWACTDPNCTEVHTDLRGDRPCGRLFLEPLVWCPCGARVLELLTCRTCGLAFMGGFPDSDGRLWPYERDLEVPFDGYDQFHAFAIEAPGEETDWLWQERSCLTTAPPVRDDDPRVRTVWLSPTGDMGRPHRCPRCQQQSSGSRKAIEPLRTRGRQSLVALVGQAYRQQPPRTKPAAAESPPAPVQDDFWADWGAVPTQPVAVGMQPGEPANGDRRALIFSDGRQDAATLAGDLSYLHRYDSFRQLLSLVLADAGEPLEAAHLKDALIQAAISRGMDLSNGEADGFWQQWSQQPQQAHAQVESFVWALLQRQITDRGLGFEALGLGQWRFTPASADRYWHAVRARPLPGFTGDETAELIHATVRVLLGEGVLLPPSLSPRDWNSDIVSFYHTKLVQRVGGEGLVWTEQADNRLTRYLRAVTEAKAVPFDAAFMAALWRLLAEAPDKDSRALVHSADPKKPGYGVPVLRLSLAILPEQVWQCQHCQYISADTVGSICIRCRERSARVSREVATARPDYYRYLAALGVQSEAPGVAAPDPYSLRALEHTAQISTDRAADRERHFKGHFIASLQESKLSHRVDILSVTTTMEMGIDIGDLSVVCMQNVPPGIANYQQRAGRAGRRSDGVATVLTWARDRSHDQYHFQHAADLVAGHPRTPRLHLDNDTIQRRHVQAVALQRFFEREQIQTSVGLFNAFGTIADLRPGTPRATRLESFFSPASPSFVALREACTRVAGRDVPVEWLTDLHARVADAVVEAHDDAETLEVLIRAGLLPRYAFPVDVVAFYREKPTVYSQGEEVQRDLQVALSEYAPGGEVVIDGHIYQSAGIYTPFSDSRYEPDGQFYECGACRAVWQSDDVSAAPPVQCATCGSAVEIDPARRPLRTIKPKSFRSNWNKKGKRYRGDGRDREGFATSAQLHAGEDASHGTAHLGGRLFVHYREGDLFMVNRAGDQKGFYICPHCGSGDGGSPNHVDLESGKKCPGSNVKEPVALMHQFRSEVVHVGLALPDALSARPDRARGRAAWQSLGAAVRLAAAAHLQVETQELAVGVRPWARPGADLQAELFLYDTLPNGAGYALDLRDEIVPILERAAVIASACSNPACEGACYSCLLDYSNQRVHGLLDRGLAADLLGYTIDGVLPVLVPERAQAALARLDAFAQEGYALNLEGAAYATMTLPDGEQVRLVAQHPLARIDEGTLRVEGRYPVNVFDLEKRPFWIWQHIPAHRFDAFYDA